MTGKKNECPTLHEKISIARSLKEREDPHGMFGRRKNRRRSSHQYRGKERLEGAEIVL